MVALHCFQHRKKSFGVLNLHHLEMLKVQKITIFSEWLSVKKVFYNRYFQQYFHPPWGGATLICHFSHTEMFRNTQCILLYGYFVLVNIENEIHDTFHFVGILKSYIKLQRAAVLLSFKISKKVLLNFSSARS